MTQTTSATAPELGGKEQWRQTKESLMSLDPHSSSRLRAMERQDELARQRAQHRRQPPRMSRAELVALAREVHVPGRADVDELVGLLADELQTVVERQQPPTPNEVRFPPVRHKSPHLLELWEEAVFARFDRLHAVAGPSDALFTATRGRPVR